MAERVDVIGDFFEWGARNVLLFLMGAVEYRSSFTTHFEGEDLEMYDHGREFAHKVTLRWWDEAH